MPDTRDDLSHPVHSDNCVLDEATGECNKIPPAYTWRDYRLVVHSYMSLILLPPPPPPLQSAPSPLQSAPLQSAPLPLGFIILCYEYET